MRRAVGARHAAQSGLRALSREDARQQRREGSIRGESARLWRKHFSGLFHNRLASHVPLLSSILSSVWHRARI